MNGHIEFRFMPDHPQAGGGPPGSIPPSGRALAAPSAAVGEPDRAEFQRARDLWRLNRFDESLAQFERALKLHPRHIAGLLDAARAFGLRYQFREAAEWLDRAVELAGHDPVVLHLVGQTYRMISRPDQAIAIFERMVKAPATVANAFMELALLYERRHRVDEAFALIEQFRKLAPNHLEARLIEAGLLRRMGKAELAESVLRGLIDAGHAPPELEARAWAGLADLFDRNREYDRAIDAISRCKAIQRGNEADVQRIATVLAEQAEAIFARVRSDELRRWRSELPADQRRRIALLTGFPRSGTTLLEKALDAHRSVASVEEPEVFARDVYTGVWRLGGVSAPSYAALDGLAPSHRLELRRRYLDAMERIRDEPFGERVLLDKNPMLTLLAPGFLRLFPETTLLVALRDPRDVVLSCYLRYLPLNTNSVWFLTLERTAQRYQTMMRSWLRLRENLPEGWVEVRYEDLVTDLESEVRRCLAAMGLPWDPGVLNYRDGLEAKPVSSPSYEAIAQPIYKTAVGRWTHYEAHLTPVFETLAPFVEEWNYD